MITAGVGGPLMGKGADILIIDDPVKNHEEALSPTCRQKTWDWYLSTAKTRLQPNASVIIIMTRWHDEDLVGLVLKNAARTSEKWTVIRFPALAEENDPLGRKPGEALWPEQWPVEYLRGRRAESEFWFTSLYQQRPRPREGGMFKLKWFEGRKVPMPREEMMSRKVRAWDYGATEGGGDYTAGVLFGRDHSGKFYVLDMVRGQWGPGERDRIIRDTAQRDGYQVEIIGEQEPGSSGKSQAAAFCGMLMGYSVHCVPSSGSKEVRADAFASQCEQGNVYVVDAHWSEQYLEELTAFPTGANDDQVDCSSNAFHRLAVGDGDYGPIPVGVPRESWGWEPFGRYPGGYGYGGHNPMGWR
jgi:predicted phage terminase large subunit-like protein